MTKLVPTDFGERMRRARDFAGLSRDALATEFQVSVSYIKKLEYGEILPKPLMADALAIALERVTGFRQAYFWGDDNPRPSPSLDRRLATLAERVNELEEERKQQARQLEELQRLGGAVSELVAGMADLSSRVASLSRGPRTGENPG